MLFFIETDRKRETVRGLRMILKLLHPRLSFGKLHKKTTRKKQIFIFLFSVLVFISQATGSALVHQVLSFLWSAILVRTITINRAISAFTKGPCLFVRGYIILSF